MKSLIAIVLFATAVYAISDDERSRLALQNPDLFEGDILGFDPDDRNVIPHKQMRWPNKTIPYVIDSSLSLHTFMIMFAMKAYEKNTCLRFVRRTTQENYIKLFKGQGCYSYVGMVNKGEQLLSLGSGCHFMGTIMHELGHAIGFFHEHNRSDRDDYLVIYWDNIQKGMENQFSLLRPSQNLLITPFDHNSIMMYGNYAFSKDGDSPTMVAKNGKMLLDPFLKEEMSRSDITRVKKMYDC